jgi:predicted DNA-binding protein
MGKLIGIRVSEGIDDILEEMSSKLGKKKSVLVRELMEQRLYDLSLVSTRLKRK